MPIFSFLIVGLISVTLSGCQSDISPTREIPPLMTDTPGNLEVTSPTLPAATRTVASPQETMTPTGTGPAGCLEKQGRLEKHQFDSKIIGKSQRVNVYLPPCYDPEMEGGYPVLFMLHGQGQNENFWVDAGIAEKSDSADPLRPGWPIPGSDAL